jgi:acetylornithine deacetylase/succinyl-diaminopimelate desuccinylase-like protein
VTLGHFVALIRRSRDGEVIADPVPAWAATRLMAGMTVCRVIRRLCAGSLLAALCLVTHGLRAQAAPFDYANLQEEATRLLVEYLRIDTSNPPGNELEAAKWLQAVLAKEGIEGQILDTVELGPGRANFYARLKGNGSKKALALVHHMDVVPATRQYWTVDPFAGTIKDGYVYGRGAIDMKGHGIIQLMTFIAIKRAGISLNRDLVLIANSDEEIGGLGSRTFISRHPDLLEDVEYLLTEGADTRVENGKVRWFGIDVGEKRPFWQQLTVNGTAAHGSVPTADNPVPRLARAIARLAAWRTPVRLSPAVARFFKAQSAVETGNHRIWLSDAAAALKSPAGRAWLLSDPTRNALLRNTISPTVLTGSNKTNTIPQVATAEVDIRLLPDEDTVVFRKELVRVIADPSVRLETIGDVPPRYDAPLGTELFKGIERVANRMLPGIPVATPVSAGASDRPYYAGAGITCYGLDPFLIELRDNELGVHGNDERLSVVNLGWGIRFYTQVIQEIQ